MQRESNGGHALSPPGPAGTGDVHPRKPGTTYLADGRYVVGPTGLPEDGFGWGRGLMQIDYGVHNAWATSADWRQPLVNITKAGELLRRLTTFFETPQSGAGVMIDRWRFTGLHDQKGVTIVAGWQDKYGLGSAGPYVDPRPLTDPRKLTLAALAAYNAGQSGVLEAIAASLPADAPTAGNDYASWILNRVEAWEAAYASAA